MAFPYAYLSSHVHQIPPPGRGSSISGFTLTSRLELPSWPRYDSRQARSARADKKVLNHVCSSRSADSNWRHAGGEPRAFSVFNAAVAFQTNASGLRTRCFVSGLRRHCHDTECLQLSTLSLVRYPILLKSFHLQLREATGLGCLLKLLKTLEHLD